MSQRLWLLMGATAALWGASYMFIKIALDDGVPAPSIVFLRVLLGAAVLVPIALRRRALGPLRMRRGWLLAVAVLQVVCPFLLITYGEKWVPTSLAAILIASSAIFVVLLSPWLARADMVGGWGLVGVGAGIAGVALLFGVDLAGSTKAIIGGAMILVAGFNYALASIWVREKLGGIQPVGIAAGTMVVATLITFVPAAAQPPDHVPSAGAIAALVALGAGGTGLAFLAYYTLIAEVGAARAAVIAYLAPAFSVCYGALFLDERITAATIMGLVLILAGSWLGAESRLPWRSSAEAHAAVRARPDLRALDEVQALDGRPEQAGHQP